MEEQNEVIDESQPVCIMMVGLPGSGKSTQAKLIRELHAENRVLVYASSDAYIEAKAVEENTTYNKAWAKYIDHADRAFHKTINDAIANKHDILIDRTNVDAASRSKFTKKMTERGYKLIAIVVECDPIELLERNEARKPSGRSIPEDVLASFAKRFQYPTTEEGFEVIISN